MGSLSHSFSRLSRPAQRLLKLLLISALFLGTWGLEATFAAPSEAEKEALKAAKALHKKGNYPNGLPKGEAPPKRPPSGCQSGPPTPGLATRGCVSMSPVWLLLIVLALIVFGLIPSWLRRERGKAQEEIVEATTFVPEVLGRTIAKDATLNDYLQAQDWEGAICFTLYQAMRRLSWNPTGKGKSLTAREVVYQVPRSEARATPLYQLLGLAEGVRFGGVTADQNLYTQAKAALEDFQKLSPKSSTPNTSHAETTGATH